MNIINTIDRLTIPNIYLKQKTTRKTKKNKKTRNKRNKRKTKNNKKKTRKYKKTRIIKEKISKTYSLLDTNSLFNKIKDLCNQLNNYNVNRQTRVILLFLLENLFIKWIITENIDINHFFTKKSAKLNIDTSHDLIKTLDKYGVSFDDVIIKVGGDRIDIKEKEMNVFVDKFNIEYPSYTIVLEKLNIVYKKDGNIKMYKVPENYIIECVDIFTGLNEFISCQEYINKKNIKEIISIFDENKKKIYYKKYFYTISQEETPFLLKKISIDIPKYYIFHDKDRKPLICSTRVYNNIKFLIDELDLTCIEESPIYKVGGMFEESSPSQPKILESQGSLPPFTQISQPINVEDSKEVVEKEVVEKEAREEEAREEEAREEEAREKEMDEGEELDRYFDKLFHEEMDVLSKIPIIDKVVEEGLLEEEENPLNKKRKCGDEEPEDIRDYTNIEPSVDIISLIPIESIIGYFSSISKNPLMLKILGLEPEMDSSYKIEPSETFKSDSSIIATNTQTVTNQEIVGNCWAWAYSRIFNKYTQVVNTIVCQELGIPIPKTLEMTITDNKMYKHLSFKFLNMTYIIGKVEIIRDPTTRLNRQVVKRGCIDKPCRETFNDIKTEIELYHVTKGLKRYKDRIQEDTIYFMNRLVNVMFHIISFDSICFKSEAIRTGCNLTVDSCLTNRAIYTERGGDFGNKVMDTFATLYLTKVRDIPSVIRYCKKQIDVFYGVKTIVKRDMQIPLNSLETNGYVDLLTKSRIIQQNIYGHFLPRLEGSLMILTKYSLRDITNPALPFILTASGNYDFSSSIEGWSLSISGVRQTYYRPDPPFPVPYTRITSKTRGRKNYSITELIELIKVLLLHNIYIELTCELDMGIFRWAGISFGGMTHPMHALVFTKYSRVTGLYDIENSWGRRNHITQMTEADLITLFETRNANISFIYPSSEIDIDDLILGNTNIWPVRVIVR